MRKVFLLTGFNNWGKTHLIKNLFKRKVFYTNKVYAYSGHQFCVQSQSNDDLGRKGYEKIINKRLSTLRKNKITPSHIFTAFCPTKELNNNSVDIIDTLYSNDEVHIIAIEYKWCLHAKLLIDEIKLHFSHCKNPVKVHVLSEKNINLKLGKLESLLKPLL